MYLVQFRTIFSLIYVNIKMSETECHSPTQLAQIAENFSQLLGTISTFRSQLTLLQNQVKTIEKSSKKYIKQLEKELTKRKI